MRNLTNILCLTLAVFVGSEGVSWGADLQKGLDTAKRGDFATALKEWNPLAEKRNVNAQFNLGEMYRREAGFLWTMRLQSSGANLLPNKDFLFPSPI